MVEPSDSQEAYDLFFARSKSPSTGKYPSYIESLLAYAIPRPWCNPDPHPWLPPSQLCARRAQPRNDPRQCRPAHYKLRAKLAAIAEWNETTPWNKEIKGDDSLGIIASGIGYVHAREAAPGASVLKLGVTYPLPMKKIAHFVKGTKRCVVIEEGDPYLVESIKANGISIEGKPEMYRFGELNVHRVRRIVRRRCQPGTGSAAR